ncbi:DUF885 domain-containing protein [Pseudoalteromonas rubra]|uniref:DUF885 domain-containing protein n=1 Tax=Pseudoalteromonas rubra TaxID=43658 RepID=A0A5S3WYK6_9GAMM|nr:DUF885 domain-containing protein [Pseudoalteromonas rubra]TMP34824.1 DUF885 domain-containing protein [Pseudoalteromonas rubra]
MNASLKTTLSRTVCAVTLALGLTGCELTQVSADQQFTSLAEQVMTFRNDNRTLVKTQLPDLSATALAAKNAERERFLQQLDALDTGKLSEENRINLTILRAQIQDQVDRYRFNAHYMPLKSESGFHSSLPWLFNDVDLSRPSGYAVYLSKLAEVPRYFQQNIDWMRKGLAVGLTQPKAVLAGYESSIEAFIVDDVTQSQFFRPFAVNQHNLPEQEFAAIQTQAKTVLSQQVIPAYREYLRFFIEEYRPGARDDIGISSTPNGVEFYRNRTAHFTTTQMTPKEIHELGLKEVARIKGEMMQIIRQTEFEGNFAEFVQFLRTDPQFYANSAEELLKEAAYIAKQMDAQLPKLFHTLPRRPYGVAPVPDAIAPKYTTGRYLGADKDTDAGYYWVNTYALDKRPLYVLEALTLHEAVPGHHLQISLNQELDYLPDYRRDSYISAFGEGWGLYAEYLGLEAGFYQDPYSNFGRLTYEMWRAARLVVDTGMHMYGWSRERAMNFMRDNTALSLHNVKTETDRYISWPGQALSYKVGELTIKRLRAKTEAALGDDFDIREFHHQILRHGSVPLNVLESQIDNYIASVQKADQTR